MATVGAGGGAGGSDDSPITEQQIIKTFSDMLESRRALIAKIGELEAQWSEHKRVLETIKVMDGSRRSYQLINGVLVETTIGEVLPKIEANKDGLYNIVQNLQGQLDKTSKEIQMYQTKYKISVQKPGMGLSNIPEPVMSDDGGSGKSTGILA